MCAPRPRTSLRRRPRSRDAPRATTRRRRGTSGDRRRRRPGYVRSQRPAYRHRGATAVTRSDLEATAEKLGLLANSGQAQMALDANPRRVDAGAAVGNGQSNLAVVSVERDSDVASLA